MTEFKVVTQSFVGLTVLSDGKEFGVEKRYAKDIKINDFKNKLELITGHVAADMKLKLLNKEKKVICDMDDGEKMLGFYPAEDGYFVQVIASQAAVGLVDDPDFKRYELTDEEYAKKKGTMKEFKMRNKLGQFADGKTEQDLKREQEAKEKADLEKKLIEAMKPGDRCQVTAVGAPTRVGTVMYLGPIANKPGYFVGVKYDEPLGKNDGSIEGKRYFDCLPNYGSFVKPEFVTVGDFPEESFDEI